MLAALHQETGPILMGLSFTGFIILFMTWQMRRQFVKSNERRYSGRSFPIYMAALLWLAIASIIAVTLGSSNARIYYHLVQHGQIGQAKIISIGQENHCFATYQFVLNNMTSIEGNAYEGRNPPCSVSNGDQLPVYYDPAKPSISTVYEPNGALLDELIPIGFMCLILPTLMVYKLCLSGFFGRKSDVVAPSDHQ